MQKGKKHFTENKILGLFDLFEITEEETPESSVKLVEEILYPKIANYTKEVKQHLLHSLNEENPGPP